MKIQHLLTILLSLYINNICATEDPDERIQEGNKHDAKKHAPIGVMGDHYHRKGEFMASIRFMKMDMGENAIGSRDISDQEIIELPNPFSMSGMPAKLSVVPENMVMDMVMIGGMYAPSDNLTWMGMIMLKDKSMDLTTYKGMKNRDQLGKFSSGSSDLSNIALSALLRIQETQTTRLHAQIGIEKSTGENSKMGYVLTPMNDKKEMIMPYGMQIGDDSASLLSALTYTKTYNLWKIGYQVNSKRSIQKDIWSFGNKLEFNIWTQRDFSKVAAWSLRIKYQKTDPIDGRNVLISAPVQTANPRNYGGKDLSLGFGINYNLRLGGVGLEFFKPIKQNLNGPQMKTNWTAQMGYHLSF
mgnify:CR=1 FL=1